MAGKDRGRLLVMGRTREYVGTIIGGVPTDSRYLERVDPAMGELFSIHLVKGDDGRTRVYIPEGMGFSRDDLLTLALELIDLAGPAPEHDPKYND